MKKNKKITSFFIIFFMVFIFSGILAKAEDNPVVHHLEGEQLKKKLIYIQQEKIKPKYDAPYVSGVDTDGNSYKGYYYPLTPTKRDRTGAIYLEDRLNLDYSFKMTGYLHFEVEEDALDNIYRENIADGIGVIFHSDDKKFVGGYGSQLGIGELSNAIGLAFDIYNNSDEGDPWIDGYAPVDEYGKDYWYNNPYTQLWITDKNGYLSRLDKEIGADRTTLYNGQYTKVDMEYDSISRELSYTVHVGEAIQHGDKNNDYVNPGGKRIHKQIVPKKFNYVYFSTTASTGLHYADQSITVESIDYVPYRTRKVIYREGNKVVPAPPGYTTEVTGFVDEQYEIDVAAPEGYEIINIQGELNGTYKLDEIIDDQLIYVNLRKLKKKDSYQIKNNENDMTRKDLKNKDDSILQLSPKPANFISNTNSNTDKIKYISIESPEGTEVISEKYPNAFSSDDWHKVVYEDNNKVFTQYFLNTENAQGIDDAKAMTLANASKFLSDLQFKVDKSYLSDQRLDEKNVTYKVSSTPIVRYQENGKVSFYKVVNNYRRVDINTLYPIKSNEADFQSKGFNYRGLVGSPSKGDTAKENQFINDLVSGNTQDSFAWTFDGNVALGANTVTPDLDNIKRHIVKFSNPGNISLTGPEESNESPVVIPQPVLGRYENTRGKVIDNMEQEILTTNAYRINDNILLNESEVLKINNHTFKKLGGNEKFPIKATNKMKTVTFVYESDYPEMTIKYLQLDRNGKETKYPIYDNLILKNEKQDDTDYAKPGSLISVVAPEKTFEGYELVKNKTKSAIDSNQIEITDNKVPFDENFTVFYYYTPVESISVPGTLNFGSNNKSTVDAMIGINENQPSMINILNTYENNGWELTASTNGLVSVEDGSYLIADILYKEDGVANRINTSSTPITQQKIALKTEIPLSSSDNKNGLFIHLLNKQTSTEYEGNIKFSFQNTP